MATRSTLRLSEAARHLVIPDGIKTSVWPRVERLLTSVGVEFDLWQQGFSSAALGCRADGKYAATIGGVVASIPRQVGKTFTVGNLLIGLAAEFPGLRVIWTSHHARTTTNTFRAMQAMVSRSKMAGLLAPNGIRTANGEQEIRFRNGSIIMFGAREHGFGRGMDAIDIEVFDEAQILSLKALEDMVPATNQARHPHGALVFFIGTPPRPNDDGEAFTAKRAAALAGKTKDQLYVEIGADPDADPDDQSQWPIMNPSFPLRTPPESMMRMRENIPDVDSWRREAMGVWPEPDAEPVPEWLVIAEDVWRRCRSGEPEAASVKPGWLVGDVTLAVEVRPDRSAAAIVAAGECREGGVGVEVVAHGAGVGWVVAEAAELVGRGGVVAVIVDEGGPAGPLIDALEAAGVDVERVAFADVKRATAEFFDAVAEAEVVHRDRAELNSAVGWAKKRPAGDTWLIDRKGDHDMCPLVGAVLARHGHLSSDQGYALAVYA